MTRVSYALFKDILESGIIKLEYGYGGATSVTFKSQTDLIRKFRSKTQFSES
jgi:hypothetical protein